MNAIEFRELLTTCKPWKSNEPSIFERVSQKIPVLEAAPEGDDLRFGPGALDACYLLHWKVDDQDQEAEKAVQRFIKSLTLPTESHIQDFYNLFFTASLVNITDSFPHKLAAYQEFFLTGYFYPNERQKRLDLIFKKDTSPDYGFWYCADNEGEEEEPQPSDYEERAFELAYWLATSSPDLEQVKVGIWLMGIFQLHIEKSIPVLTLLAQCESLALFAIEALYKIEATQGGIDLESEFLKIAKLHGGWGRIFAVIELCHLRLSSETKRWLVREGCRNGILISYTAVPCALAGDLLEELKAPDPDEALLLGASAILGWLCDESYLWDITDLPHGGSIVWYFLVHVHTREFQPQYMSAIEAIRNFVHRDDIEWSDVPLENWNSIMLGMIKDLLSKIQESEWGQPINLRPVIGKILPFRDLLDQHKPWSSDEISLFERVKEGKISQEGISIEGRFLLDKIHNNDEIAEKVFGAFVVSLFRADTLGTFYNLFFDIPLIKIYEPLSRKLGTCDDYFLKSHEHADTRLNRLATIFQRERESEGEDRFWYYTAYEGTYLEEAFELAYWLATASPHEEQVKVGIWLLGVFQLHLDRSIPVLRALARDETLVFFAIESLYRIEAANKGILDLEAELLQIAQMHTGWGRIFAVIELCHMPLQPSTKRWLLREGCKNNIDIALTAISCAEAGGLLEELKAPYPDDELLLGTAAMLTALSSPPMKEEVRSSNAWWGLEELPQGAAITWLFLQHIDSKEFRHEYLAAMRAIIDSICYDFEWTNPDYYYVWTAEMGEKVSNLIMKMREDPKWQN